MGKRKWLTTLALTLTLAVPAVVRADPPRYRVEVIGDSRTSVSTFGLNNLGQVVVNGRFGDDEEAGSFIYSQGQLQRLQGLGLLPRAEGLNDRGEVVGSMNDPANNQIAFLYRDGHVTDISAPLGAGIGPALAAAINDRGHAVGSAGNKAFFYDGQTSRFISHPSFGSASVTAWGLNDHDAVVGWTYNAAPGEQFTFIWRDGELTRIPGLLEGAGANAQAINNAGQVVGVAAVQGGSTRPFLYSDGVTHDLGSLGGEAPNDFGGDALDINDRGWIVGTSVTSTPRMAGYLYMDGQMHNLNSLLVPAAAAAWDVVQASQVNNAGQILAAARRSGDVTTSALLLSPVPEPQALALWLAGLALVGTTARARRRQQGPA